MADFLSTNGGQAIDIVVASLGPVLKNCDPADAKPSCDAEVHDNHMSGFFSMPHG